jgi:hypothetical protein
LDFERGFVGLKCVRGLKDCRDFGESWEDLGDLGILRGNLRQFELERKYLEIDVRIR